MGLVESIILFLKFNRIQRPVNVDGRKQKSYLGIIIMVVLDQIGLILMVNLDRQIIHKELFYE